MTITLTPELAEALNKRAQELGTSPEAVVIETLHARFLHSTPIDARDEWEQLLLGIASNCGVSLPNSALTSEELYD